MWVVFIGGAMVTRRNTHIAVELLSNVMRPGPLRTALLAFVDIIKLGFIGLLAYFSLDHHRAHEHPAHDGVRHVDELGLWRRRVGCFLMLSARRINVWRNARAGWRKPHDVTHQIAAD